MLDQTTIVLKIHSYAYVRLPRLIEPNVIVNVLSYTCIRIDVYNAGALT